jgi:hypothetical protein
VVENLGNLVSGSLKKKYLGKSEVRIKMAKTLKSGAKRPGHSRNRQRAVKCALPVGSFNDCDQEKRG